MAQGKSWAIAGVVVLATGAWAIPTYPKETLFAVLGVKAKLMGMAEPCTWAQIFESGAERTRMSNRSAQLKSQVKVVATDAALNIEQVSSPEGTYWIRSTGSQFNGAELLAYLLAEHEWMRGTAPERSVKPGDVVIDAGAHVGVFTRNALKWGAAKVLAIEPDPVNRECLRRNLAEEIAAGRVIIAPVAVWNAPGTLTLHFGVENSGMSSLIEDAGAGGVEVPLARLDDLVKEYGLAKVDFIKMDIEGAEREALKGAAGTLQSFHPSLMLDSYHRLDDMQVLPQIIAEISGGKYQSHCGPCEPNVHGMERFNPHMTYYWQ